MLLSVSMLLEPCAMAVIKFDAAAAKERAVATGEIEEEAEVPRLVVVDCSMSTGTTATVLSVSRSPFAVGAIAILTVCVVRWCAVELARCLDDSRQSFKVVRVAFPFVRVHAAR